MKKIFSILLMSLFSFALSAQINSGEIIYKVKATPDFDEWVDSVTSKIEDEMAASYVKKQMTQTRRALPHLKLQLKFNATEAIFEQEANMASDNEIDLEIIAGSAGVSGKYYTNLKEGIALQQFKFEKTWLIEEDIKDLDWKITGETKEIAGYQTRKATTTIDLNDKVKGEITAWFTTDLPYQFGPIDVRGLPGLILGLERNHYYFYADEINLKEKDLKIKRPTKGKKVSREEYTQYIKELTKEFE